MDLIQLLEQQIISHPHLKEEDKAVVTQLCEFIRIDTEADINEYFKLQVEAEAGVVYLKGKYSRLLNKFASIVEKHRSGKSVELGSRDPEGYKWNKASKHEWLTGTDARYAALVSTHKDVEVLSSIIKDLAQIVFNRDRKLEQLSNNYRREMQVDSNTCR